VGTLTIAGRTFAVVQSGKTESRPAIVQAGVVNAASFLQGISSATWVAIRGTKLASTTRSWSGSDFAGSKLPTQLDGVSVKINGKPAPLSYISPTQINALAPDDATLGNVAVEVTTSEGTSDALIAQKQSVSPAFFMFDADGRRYVAAVNLDGAYLGRHGLYPGLNFRPAKPGNMVMLFGTGFGFVTPAKPSDEVVDAPGRLSSPPVVRIGGVQAEVQWAGLTSPGLYQFNVVVPDVPDGDQAVIAEILGGVTQAGAFVTVLR
jgi:uncharacterized protein (TIGR03437 family)